MRHSPTDGELMSSIAEGDIGQLGEIYRRYGNVVFRFICRLLVNEPVEQAEDLCQEVFLAAAEAAPKYEDRGKFRSWILGVAVRTTRSWQRRRWLMTRILMRNKNTSLAMAAPIVGGPESEISSRQEIRRAMSKLTPDQRAVLLLRATEEMSGREIAETLGITENAVWLRLKRAHKILGGLTRDRQGLDDNGAM